MFNSIISEMFLYNEKDGTSPLLHPTIEKPAVELYLKAKEKGRDLGAYLVRQSFLISSIDWNIREANRFGRSLIPPHPIPESDKNKDGTINSSGVLGIAVYPLFTMANSALFFSHTAMNYSIKIIASVFEGRWQHSIHSANTEKQKKKIRDVAGKEISELITKAWVWASELKDSRDLMEHYNPLQSQPVVTFTSSDGINYDGFRFLLSSNPEARQARGEGQTWGKEAMSYCVKTFERVVQYNKELIPLLMEKYK